MSSERLFWKFNDIIHFEPTSITSFFSMTSTSTPTESTSTIIEKEIENENQIKIFKQLLNLLMNYRRDEFEIKNLIETPIETSNPHAIQLFLCTKNNYQLSLTPRQFRCILFNDQFSIELIKSLLKQQTKQQLRVNQLDGFDFEKDYIDDYNRLKELKKFILWSTIYSPNSSFNDNIKKEFQKFYNDYLEIYDEPIEGLNQDYHLVYRYSIKKIIV
ncbi:hypothetical protein ACTFIU_007388 [Dictyostelium citrinum]